MKLWTPSRKLLTRRNFVRGLSGAIAAPAVLRHARCNGLILPQLTGAGSGAGGGGGGYVAKAVHFDQNTYLEKTLPLTGISSGSQFTTAFWLNNTVSPDQFPVDNIVWQSAPNVDILYGSLANGNTPFYGAISNAAGANTYSNSTPGNVYVITNSWTSVLMSMDTTPISPSKLVSIAINGVSVSPSLVFDYMPSLVVPLDGSDDTTIAFGSSPNTFSTSIFDVADFQFWVGVYVDFTNPANVAKFISGGKPVAPSAAATAFGQQTVLFSGDVTGFPVNQGTGGAFTLTGTLTNATSPSN